MSYGYEEALRRRAADTNPQFAGGSGYFAPRASALDPSLFEGETVRPQVRAEVLDILYRFLSTQTGLVQPVEYMRVWLAGSGITTAWDSDREAGGAPGDLDVLLGVDYGQLRARNHAFSGSTDDDIAHYLNHDMQQRLWPAHSHQRFGGAVYELTYYINPGCGAAPNDILAINPYAAYDISSGQWTQRPVVVPTNFDPSYFSDQARDRVTDDNARAHIVAEVYNTALAEVNGSINPGRERNALIRLHDAVRQGAALFDSIHDGRHAAFAAGGKGFFDDANFRWQAGKGNGTVAYLRTIKQLDQAAHADVSQGEDSIGHLLLVASLANGGS